VVARTIRLDGVGLIEVVLCVAGLLGITAGTLYQKKYCSALDLRTGALIQYVASALAMAVLSVVLEHQMVEWTWRFVAAFLWLSLVLSIGAIFLLFILIRRGAASRVASLFYLVPPVTALMAYLALDETLRPTALLGMALAALGVALVNR